MAEYHYVACHDCQVVGMLPKTSAPEEWYKEWVEQFGHTEHETGWASEYDSQFEARTEGKKITGYEPYYGEPITEKIGEPYKDIDKETMNFEWRENNDT